MKVTLQNYCKGQTVFHSELVILKGQLTVDPVPGEEDGGSVCGSVVQSPTSGVCGVGGIGLPPFEFEIWHRRKISGAGAKEEELAVPHLSYRSRFVCILKLGEGLNQIKFCEKETGSVFDEFSLKYSPDEGKNFRYIQILNVVSATAGSDSVINAENISIMPKLKLGLSLIQSLFAEKLFENGFERRSFSLASGDGKTQKGADYYANSLFKINLSPEEIAQMSTADLWEYIAKEIRGREGVWDKNCKYVAFVSHPWKVHYEHHHHNHNSQSKDGSSGTTEKLALGGGGLAIIGTSFMEIWPSSVEQILKTVFSERKLWTTELENCAARFGAVNRTEGSLYAASLGSVIHEMGHIFDLGHTDSGLMGNEFNRIDTSLSPVLSYPPVAELFRMKLGADVALMMMLRPKVGLPNSGCLSEDLLSIGISCATLLYFHKWFQPNSGSTSTDKTSTTENVVLLRNKIVSKTSTLVTLQVRDTEDERLLKSWTFVEKTSRDPSDHIALCSTFKEFTLAKNHIPIPVCQRGDSNRALVVAEDCDGNLLKTVVSRDSLSESFTVIRRRT